MSEHQIKARYSDRLDLIVDRLGEIAEDRVITRTYREFGQQPADQLAQGIYTVVSAGVRSYPNVYESGDEGRQRIFIIFQGKAPEGASGEDIEEIEFDAMNELELLAEQIPLDIPTLVLQSAETSTQLDSPYCWVRSTWETFTDPKS